MTTCPLCLRSLPRRPGPHLHGAVSHVCRLGRNGAGEVRPDWLSGHPVWTSQEEREANLEELLRPKGVDEIGTQYGPVPRYCLWPEV